MSKKQLGAKNSAKQLNHAQATAREQKTKASVKTKAVKTTAPQGDDETAGSDQPSKETGPKNKSPKTGGTAQPPTQGDSPLDPEGPSGGPATANSSKGQLLSVHPSKIQPSPFQHRTVFDKQEMEELQKDIKQNGIHTPLLVRHHPTDPELVELVTGERRLRVSIELALETVPIILRPLKDREVQEIQWSENFRRVNPDLIDEATSLKGMLPYHQSADRLAVFLGKPRTYVRGRLRLLDLSADFQQMVRARVLNLKQALQIAILGQEAQTSFYDAHCSHWKTSENFSLRNFEYLLQVYKSSLNQAIFDPADADLVPSAKACTDCPFNSANYRVLFPEMDKTRLCSKPSCYREKCQAQMRRNLLKAIDEHQPTAIVYRGQMLDLWGPILAELEQTIGWPRYRAMDVNLNTSSRPDRACFASDESYQETLEHSEQKIAERDACVLTGEVVKAICFDGYKVSLEFIDLRWRKPKAQTEDVSSLKMVEDHLKAGTATVAIMEEAINLVNRRDQKAQTRDKEKIQASIHAAYCHRVDELGSASAITEVDYIGLRLMAYLELDYDGRDALHEIIPFAETNSDGSPQTLYQWLSSLSLSQMAFMVRLAIARKSEASDPGSLVAETMTHMAQSLEVDVPGIAKSLDADVAKRVQTRDRRLALLEHEKNKLQNKG